jgi:hypothetical protein
MRRLYEGHGRRRIHRYNHIGGNGRWPFPQARRTCCFRTPTKSVVFVGEKRANSRASASDWQLLLIAARQLRQ